MIPLELKLAGVRAFGNHVVNLGDAGVQEVVVFGPNGSGKSTIARMIQALSGDPPDDLHRSYLDERDSRMHRKAQVELKVANPRGRFHNPDWPDEVVLGLEFGFENNRVFTRYYLVIDGQRTNFTSIERYAQVFRHHPFYFKDNDRFMFVHQGEAAAMLRLKPRQLYHEMKSALGLEDLEQRWRQTLEARESAAGELRRAGQQHDELQQALRRKAWARDILLDYRRVEAEYAEIRRTLARDRLVTLTRERDRLHADEQGLDGRLARELAARASLEAEQAAGEARLPQVDHALQEGKARELELRKEHQATSDRAEQARSEVAGLEHKVRELESILTAGLSRDALEAQARALQEKLQANQEFRKALESRLLQLQAERDGAAGARARAEAQLEQAQAELAQCLQVLGSLPGLDQLDQARAQASAAQERAGDAATRCRDDHQAARQRLQELEENQVTTPASTRRALAELARLQGRAWALCEALEPAPGLDWEQQRAVEGALGELCSAILLEDGRVLVDYDGYVIYQPSTGAVGPGLTGLLEVDPSLPSLPAAAARAVLEAVTLAPHHQAAADLARAGSVAYTPDGYRYDGWGRRHSVPASLLIGRRAYQLALKAAQEESTRTLQLVQRAETDLARARQHWQEAQDRWDRAARARSRREELETVLPALEAARAGHAQHESRCRQELEDRGGQRDQALQEDFTLRRQLDDVNAQLLRLQALEDLPRLAAELDGQRREEAAARQAAEACLGELRQAERLISQLRSERENLRTRLDQVRHERSMVDQRARELEEQLDRTRASLGYILRELPGATREWGAAFGTSQEEALAGAAALAPTYVGRPDAELQELSTRAQHLAGRIRQLEPDLVPTAEEDYLAARAQFDGAEQELKRVQAAYAEASSREEAAQEDFQRVMTNVFDRISRRFETYLAAFGWRGYLRPDPVQGTDFELNVYLSVYEDVEPRLLGRNRSGGEMSAVAALLNLAMVRENPRPFYVFDEVDQSLDPANVLKLAALLREELDCKYFLISHRLNRSHLEAGQFGIGVYRAPGEGSRTRVYRRRNWPAEVAP
ncbi:MAG: AAA family ATPase [Bacillota bacterium]